MAEREEVRYYSENRIEINGKVYNVTFTFPLPEKKKKDTVILTYGNVIHKYDQPAPNNGVSYDEILEKNSLKHKKAVIQLDANKLIKALQGSKTGAYKEKIMIEIGNPREPIFIHYGADNQKMLLPIYSGN